MTRSALFAAFVLGSSAIVAVPQVAHAAPYSFATQNITNFNLVPLLGNYTIPGSGLQDTGTSTNTSTFGNTNNNTLDSKPFGTLANATEATSGSGPFPAPDNYSNNAGLSLGMNGARGDSWINTGTGQNVAEVRISDGSTPAGASSGKGVSSWGITVDAGTILRFSFNDDVMLEASTALAGDGSDASIATAYSITDSNGNVIFNFTPDGSGAGNIVGGLTESNPFNLQSAVGSVSGFPLDSTLANTSSSDYFEATTSALAAGDYLVHVRTTSQADAQLGEQQLVPEPASMTLLAAGLIGAGVVRRRR